TNGLHGRYAENTAVGETCRRLCAWDVWAVRHRSTGDRMLRTRSTRKTGLAAAVAVSALALLAVGAPAASAAPAATQQATNTCWKTVVNDWLNNQPNLKGSYPIPCYTLPLLVLGGLALLLFLTAAATWLTRRLQARRVTPAPAPARAASSVRPKP